MPRWKFRARIIFRMGYTAAREIYLDADGTKSSPGACHESSRETPGKEI